MSDQEHDLIRRVVFGDRNKATDNDTPAATDAGSESEHPGSDVR